MLSTAERRCASGFSRADQPIRSADDDSTFGEVLKSRRKARRLSQRGLAKLMHVSASAVAQWELDETTPSDEHLGLLQDILDISILSDPAISSLPLTKAVFADTTPAEVNAGERIEDPDELALLRHWRTLNREERIFTLKVVIGLIGLQSQGNHSDD